MPEVNMLWNLLLSVAAGGTVWWVRGVNVQIAEVRKLISITREEMAREYALKVDVDKDIQKIMNRFDRLEMKLDKIMDRVLDSGKK